MPHNKSCLQHQLPTMMTIDEKVCHTIDLEKKKLSIKFTNLTKNDLFFKQFKICTCTYY